MERPVQYFTDEYIEYCRKLTPDQIVDFLEQWREVAHAGIKSPSKLISIKVPENLLNAFKFKAKSKNQPYQSVIKNLMREWLLNNNN
jgi:predicted DNA binding CopG/RHH family protein